ncbi:MAG: NAD(+)/NADH kinase [Verrucomicrobia bacterium]|nr:NAD(+)/NADH kinase [Verrucomicrobiota bacterium]MDA1086837.1 NAD(+)/NADH kinase [Verrucomicrobiota bacterium]
MKTVGVLVNVQKPRAAEVLARLDVLTREAGLKLICDDSASRFIDTAETMSTEAMLDRMDVLMALGGDGSMLKAVRVLDGRDKPVIGVNIGSLGFLTSVAEHDLEGAVSCLASDDYRTSERSLISCQARCDGTAGETYRALNDVVIRSDSPRVIALELLVDGELVCTYVCDGMIISTPTGSTGHNLSANGPILHPEARVLLVTLLCPHTLSSRPLVLTDQSVIAVKVVNFSGAISFTVDGQVGEPLGQDAILELSMSDQRVKFIHLPDYSYFRVLRHKLGWRGSSV